MVSKFFCLASRHFYQPKKKNPQCLNCTRFIKIIKLSVWLDKKAVQLLLPDLSHYRILTTCTSVRKDFGDANLQLNF